QSNTKEHTLTLADYLDKKLALDQPINIHLTDYPNSCAQHYIDDIGLLNTKNKDEKYYHVFVGSNFGANQTINHQIFTNVSFTELPQTLEKILKRYLRRREPAETFQRFTQRHDLNNLQAIFSNDE